MHKSRPTTVLDSAHDQTGGRVAHGLEHNVPLDVRRQLSVQQNVPGKQDTDLRTK